MADRSAADRLNDFMAMGPQRDQFKKSRIEGRGKTAKVLEETDEAGYQRALQQFKSDNADVIGHLKDSMALENAGMQSDLTRQSAQDTLSAQLNAYLGGGEHRGWELGGLGGLVGGGLLGRGIAKLSAQAPAGTGPWGRASYAVVPALESLLGLGKGAEQYLTRPDQLNDPRGYDLHQASMQTLGAAGLGAFTGGIENALANRGAATAAPAPPPPVTPEPPAPLPPPEPALEKGMQHGAATKEIARFLGQPVSGAKSDVTDRSIKALADASDDQIRGLASSLNGRGFSMDLGADSGALRKAVRGAIKQISNKSGTLASLGALGLGGYEALSPDESQAGGLPTEGPGQNESLTQYRLRNLGLPSTPEEAGQTALDMTPVIGEARLGTALGQTGRGILGALNPPTSVMGNLGDPRLARYRNWVEDQRKAGNDPHQQAMADLADHMDMMHKQYGQSAGVPGAGMPTGGGMPGLTGVSGAGGGLPAQPAALPPQTGMGGMAPQRQAGMSTADILAAMNAGRERGALLAMLAGGTMQ